MYQRSLALDGEVPARLRKAGPREQHNPRIQTKKRTRTISLRRDGRSVTIGRKLSVHVSGTDAGL